MVSGTTAPTDNSVGGVTVPQSGSPAVGTLQINRGDYQISINRPGSTGIAYDNGILLASITQNLRDGVRATVEAGRNSFSDGYLTLSVTQAGQIRLNRSQRQLLGGLVRL